MPQVIYPDTLASVIADLQTRLIRLEVNRPSPPQLAPQAMTVLLNAAPAPVAGLGFTTSWTEVSKTAFSLASAQSVFGFCSSMFFGSGGTAAYVYQRIVIWASDGSTVLAVGSGAVHAVTPGVGSAALLVLAPLPAGNYYIGTQYRMDAGATTTFSQGGTNVLPRHDLWAIGNGTVAIP